MRIMAAENRLRRRLLSRQLADIMSKPVPKGHRFVRVHNPGEPGYPFYVFLLVAQPDFDATYEEYREFRSKLLEALCLVTKLRFPEAEDIIGIATEPGDAMQRSEDTLYLDAREWSDDMRREAMALEEDLGLLKDVKMT